MNVHSNSVDDATLSEDEIEEEDAEEEEMMDENLSFQHQYHQAAGAMLTAGYQNQEDIKTTCIS